MNVAADLKFMFSEINPIKLIPTILIKRSTYTCNSIAYINDNVIGFKIARITKIALTPGSLKKLVILSHKFVFRTLSLKK